MFVQTTGTAVMDTEKPQLFQTVEYGLLEASQRLISEGHYVDCLGPYSRTPLHIATTHGHIDLVRLLLHHRADISLRDSDGLSALHCACMIGNIDIVCMLLAAGARVGETDGAGHTSLHFVAGNSISDIGVVKLVLEHSNVSDVLAADRANRMPCDCATDPEITNLLKHTTMYAFEQIHDDETHRSSAQQEQQQRQEQHDALKWSSVHGAHHHHHHHQDTGHSRDTSAASVDWFSSIPLGTANYNMSSSSSSSDHNRVYSQESLGDSVVYSPHSTRDDSSVTLRQRIMRDYSGFSTGLSPNTDLFDHPQGVSSIGPANATRAGSEDLAWLDELDYMDRS